MLILTLLAFVVLVSTASASCGITGRSRIVGGQEATEHSWPWQASLRQSSWLSTTHICGASIISEKWLVTASHCVDGATARSLKIVVGDHHKTSSSSTEVTHSINRIIMHEDYDGNSLSTDGLPHDIALIEVSAPMEFNEQVQPVCLPGSTDHSFVNNEDCWITGWGTTAGTGNENVLNELNIEVRTQSSCRQAWGNNYIKEGHICVGHGQTGACNGDSGGPLVCGVNGRYVLAGATSWGRSGCQTEGYPSVYTRVSKYLDWIAANTMA